MAAIRTDAAIESAIGSFAEDVHAAGQRRVDDLLVVGGWHNHGAEVGLVFSEGPLNVCVALGSVEAEEGLCVLKRIGIDVDSRYDFNEPVLNIGRQI